MKKKSSISLGPGAPSLILIFVVLSLSVLGMLCLMTSRNDLRLSERSAQVVEAVYQLNGQAEEHRAEIDRILLSCRADGAADEDSYLAAVEELLPEDMSLEDGEITWVESDGSRMLDCAVAVLPLTEDALTAWSRHNLSAETGEELWN
ncbi:MAG: hypothetical protein IKP40_05805 [Clostridia bacterium]|nr:hypothetical protein [Clostridia bacterium]